MGDHYFGLTDRGKIRENNEDAYLAKEMPDTRLVLACVIDGVGGYEGGEIASAIAKTSIEEAVVTASKNAPKVLRESIYLANRRIIEEKKLRPGMEKMACVLTLAVADIEQNQFYYAHVGDTRLYLLRGQSLIKVTKDHSFVGFLEDSSRISEDEAMHHPKRNEVNKALGFDPNMSVQQDYVEIGSSPFLPGDLMLLCSDGLTDMVSAKEISEILTGEGGIAQKARLLIEAANSAGGRDNITVVLVHNYKVRLTQEPTLPVSRKSTESLGTGAEKERIQMRSMPRGRNPAIVWILLFVCVGLIAALVWQINFKKPVIASGHAVVPASIVKVVTRSVGEQILTDSLNNTDEHLILDSNTFKGHVLITDTLIISKDSLHISGNGIVLRGDTALNGPAILLQPTARYVFLENMVFENFPIAIMANNNVLRLSNVRFRNCGVPVSYQLHFANDAYVNGLVREGLFFETDSSLKK